MFTFINKKHLIILITLISTTLFAENFNFSVPSTNISTPFAGGAPQITSDSSGRYVFAIWVDNTPEIQTARSADFSQSWNSPANLGSGAFGLANASQITTDSSGKYVFAIWSDGTDIRTARSDDFSQNWDSPLPITLGTGVQPQIVTDSSGRYVFTIWLDGNDIQTAGSNDFGISWSFPPSLGSGAVDLSNLPQILTNSSGRYVFAMWQDSSFDTQTARSIDFGQTWSLTKKFISGAIPKIATDSSGKYVFAIWITAGPLIETARSDDFGQNWSLIINFGPTDDPPQITANSTGRYVFPIWVNTDVLTSQGLRTFFPLNSVSISRN
ncbi:MAG: hypothetical protein K1060chlam4_00276 [Candidatus Anoxychlamydiales bacterium]|nr:hypothetical protein [Candidatus Anoxychlamydiales bacterium]